MIGLIMLSFAKTVLERDGMSARGLEVRRTGRLFKHGVL